LNKEEVFDYVLLLVLGTSFVVSLFFVTDIYYSYPNASIEASYFNGLLTASSILLGFSTWIIEKNPSRLKLVLLVTSISILFFSVLAMVDVALGKTSDSWGLLWLGISFLVTGYLAIYSTLDRIGKTDRSIKSI